MSILWLATLAGYFTKLQAICGQPVHLINDKVLNGVFSDVPGCYLIDLDQ